ncbi:Asp_Arg_hydrox domain-containing protein, partial [Haematococcus lacustris]
MKLNAVLKGREDNMAQFKPGVRSMYLIFSDQSTAHAYHFPYYQYFQQEVQPLMQQ